MAEKCKSPCKTWRPVTFDPLARSRTAAPDVLSILGRRVPRVYPSWANQVFLVFFAFNGIR
jgi:hypothetical protein